MAYSEAQKKATIKYMKNNLDDIKTRVPKGKREEYKEKARLLGYDSFNSFVVQAIEEKINREVLKNE
ncbi:MAG: hypothetical protein SOR79_02000 [Blautia sp.]|uniref:hypothetical protein n=1 Tax=Blautia sp. TaxID=1955243 RepID=UPI0015A5CB60|nr:hypothetical protein [Blautia sp.]MDY3015906.1 hypothetical protein [Blautia sp.]